MAESIDGGRIFVNGEELTDSAIRANGGGDKHHPQTIEQARANLAPQLTSVRAAIAAIPDALKAERVVLEAEVFANYLANSYFPEDLVTQLKLRPLGSKVVEHGIQSLPSTGETDAVSKSFLLSADAQAVKAMEAILAGTAGTKGAADDLRQFTKITVSTAHRATVDGVDGALKAFEAVLHPDPDASTVFERSAAAEPTLTKFEALVESVGGRVLREHNDVVDGLTFVALKLPPERVEDVAAFNPLRSLTPAPKVTLMDGVLDAVDSDGMLEGPEMCVGLPEVLIFDGGIDDGGRVFRGNATAVNLTGEARTKDAANHAARLPPPCCSATWTIAEPCRNLRLTSPITRSSRRTIRTRPSSPRCCDASRTSSGTPTPA